MALLFLLAVLDLSVGVSNDAVNFLNSAIGSRVASRQVILIVAGFGVLAGSLFSSGIMEVARSGIFNPELFTFADVMVIFLAVMLADVLLLDLFNTLGLPTSTTVSIVFELLGASVAVALFLVLSNPDAGSVLDYVNTHRAIIIISGIGLSIVVAFAVGTLVQFFSRMLFTFQEQNHTSAIRVGWSAIAFTVISFFLLVKGLKGASFVLPETSAFIYENAVPVTLVMLGVWSVVMWVLNRIGVNVLAIVVFGGTFSLALAFASNDLVNFIGVPLAGLSSWQAWTASGLAPDQLTMEALSGPVQGNTLILLAAGGVMVVTLWLSSKARSVTQTEVSLGRQDDGAERFKPGPVSRSIVRSVVATGDAASRAVPKQWRVGLASRFAREKASSFDLNQPAFDTLRASVNLTVASILIVFATSMKLPLSTTFVSFMVAMGTSLADRAWGRDSAVYRVAGVFSVVSGWFVTAAVAFLMAFAFASLIRNFGGPAVVVLVALAAAALAHSHRYHARRTAMDRAIDRASPERLDKTSITLRQHFADSLVKNGDVVDKVITALVKRKRKTAKKLHASLQADVLATHDTENEFVRRLDKVKPKVEPWLMRQLDVLACERDLLQSATTLAEFASEHVLNEHTPPTDGVTESLQRLKQLFRNAFADLAGDKVKPKKRASTIPVHDISTELDTLTSRILEDLYSGERSARNTTLLLGIALEMRDMQRELQRAASWQ
ncbi:MAG: inorganic phosphate transporter [Woeseiaceae bacterium]|nr:inorganic phosphate transporter [Woeseiaceae bacterium]